MSKSGRKSTKVKTKSQELIALFEEYIHVKDENLKNKAVKLANDICTTQNTLSAGYVTSDKLLIFQILCKYDSNAADEILARWRDSLTFLQDDDLTEAVDLLVNVVNCQSLNSHERIYTAVHLYNLGFINVCYKCFGVLADDMTVLIDHRLEAIRFLYAASNLEKTLAQEYLIEIIQDLSLPVKFRYESIASYISKTGINSLMNTQKLKIPYDEDFVFTLQLPFFMETKNDVRYRILSGQHLLQMADKTFSKEDKLDVSAKLLDIARDLINEENIRADAADIILRLGDNQNRVVARKIITDLGYSADGEKKRFTPTSIYDNSQNVHNSEIDAHVQSFLTKMLTPSNDRDHSGNPMKNFREVNHEITTKVRERKDFNPKTRHAIYRTMSRISVDTATFTEYKATLAEIISHVWSRICSSEFDKDTCALLENRMFDELSDMSDTCSSGHASRFVNIFSVIDGSLAISWKDQIQANVKGRMEARMRDCTDETIQMGIAMGMMEDADKEDRDVYLKFIKESLLEIETELFEEFVEEGYIKDVEFDEHFENTKKEWLN